MTPHYHLGMEINRLKIVEHWCQKQCRLLNHMSDVNIFLKKLIGMNLSSVQGYVSKPSLSSATPNHAYFKLIRCLVLFRILWENPVFPVQHDWHANNVCVWDFYCSWIRNFVMGFWTFLLLHSKFQSSISPSGSSQTKSLILARSHHQFYLYKWLRSFVLGMEITKTN